MGGMAAQIPIKNNPEANEIALDKVRQDKEREVKNGHDGTWVAHPALVQVAMEQFDKYMPTANQKFVKREDVNITAEDLVEIPVGTVTEAGIRKNVNVGVLYIEAWLRGNGAVALYNLMEDAATAEISRIQVWQWLKAEVELDDKRVFNYKLFKDLFDSEVEHLVNQNNIDIDNNQTFKLAVRLFEEFATQAKFEEFLTTTAYNYI
jgi:malate synthase